MSATETERPAHEATPEHLHRSIAGSTGSLLNGLKDRNPDATAVLFKHLPMRKLRGAVTDGEFMEKAFGNEQQTYQLRRTTFIKTMTFVGETASPRAYGFIVKLMTSRPISRLLWGKQANERIIQLTEIHISTADKAIKGTPNGRQHN